MTDSPPPWTRDEPQSPCINICVLHPSEGICVGCYRTLEEIAAWGSLSPQQRRDILDQLDQRKPRLKKRRGGRNGRRSD